MTRSLFVAIVLLIVTACGEDGAWRQQLDKDIYLLNLERKQKARLVETAAEMQAYLEWSRAEQNKVLDRYKNHEDPQVATRIKLYQEVGNRQLDVLTAVIARIAALEDFTLRYQQALSNPAELARLSGDVRMYLQALVGLESAIDSDREAVRLQIAGSDLEEEYKRELWGNAQSAFLRAKADAGALTPHQYWLQEMLELLEFLGKYQGEYQQTEQGLVFSSQSLASLYNLHVESMQRARERLLP